eukprot:TRINITY_DN8028_c0_g1_i1.p1 TRINITY_DN8028_c0_g1~~TRINITY_DN8028_c0_g1_i1.p1  ORF type:complete len:161 (+),score=50.46 TRINITY_DN8028_c0_g1_i1:222-704(+)
MAPTTRIRIFCIVLIITILTHSSLAKPGLKKKKQQKVRLPKVNTAQRQQQHQQRQQQQQQQHNTPTTHRHRSKTITCSPLISTPVHQVDSNALLEKAVAFIQAKQFEEAAKCAQDCVDFFPNNPNGHFHLGNIFRSLNRHEEALGMFQQVSQLAPSFVLL